MTDKLDYVLDETGTAPSNRIIAERHSVSYNDSAQYHFIIPGYAPFFARSVKLFRIVGGNRIPMVERVDYNFGLRFHSASLALAKPVYSSINILNMEADSVFEIEEYQTLGGPHVQSSQQTLSAIARIVYNPASMTWEEVIDTPTVYRSVDHTWEYSNVGGQTDMVSAILAVASALANRAANGGDHSRIKGNPHDTSKFDMDLGNVPNYGMASIEQALAGESNESFMSPAMLRQVLMTFGLVDLSDLAQAMREHLANENNPHRNSKDSVGLSELENLPVATGTQIARRGNERVYITLDMLNYYMKLHGNGGSNTAEPIKQGALLSTYCNNNYDRIGVYADGRGGTYDSILQVKDKTCGYQTEVPIAIPKKGDVMHSYCSGSARMELVSDGLGGVFTRVGDPAAPECGNAAHPPRGHVIARNCEGTTEVRTVADGQGGSNIERTENSEKCGANIHPERGQLLSYACEGTAMMGNYADGQGGFYQAVITINDPSCGYIAPTVPPASTYPPAGTLMGDECQGTTLYDIRSDGVGGRYTTVREANSVRCGGTGNVPPTVAPTQRPQTGSIRLSTTHTRIYNDTVEVQTYTMAGWKPHTTYLVDRVNNSIAWGDPNIRSMGEVSITTDANGSGSYTETITFHSIMPLGRYTCWLEVKGTDVRSASIDRWFLGNRT